MSASELQPIQQQESYSQEDVQEILQLAIANKTDKDELSRAELLEIAAELDIEGDCLEAAEKAWLAQKSTVKQKLAFDLYRKDKLKQKAIGFAIVNTFLISLNLIAVGHLSWSLYILLLWGLKLTLDTWKTFQSQGDAYEKAFQSWKFKQELSSSVGSIWEKVKKGWQT